MQDRRQTGRHCTHTDQADRSTANFAQIVEDFRLEAPAVATLGVDSAVAHGGFGRLLFDQRSVHSESCRNPLQADPFQSLESGIGGNPNVRHVGGTPCVCQAATHRGCNVQTDNVYPLQINLVDSTFPHCISADGQTTRRTVDGGIIMQANSRGLALTVCSLCVLFGPSAMAQERYSFQVLDADGNGALSRVEFGVLPDAPRLFADLDLNFDRLVSLEEWITGEPDEYGVPRGSKRFAAAAARNGTPRDEPVPVARPSRAVQIGRRQQDPLAVPPKAPEEFPRSTDGAKPDVPIRQPQATESATLPPIPQTPHRRSNQ